MEYFFIWGKEIKGNEHKGYIVDEGMMRKADIEQAQTRIKGYGKAQTKKK